MVNIELELVSDVNLDQAFCVRSPHTCRWASQSPGRGLAVKISPKASPPCPQASRPAREWGWGEDHLTHATCRLLMALELRERTAQARAAGPALLMHGPPPRIE